MEIAHPSQGIPDDVLANLARLRTADVDRSAPGVRSIGNVGAELFEVVARRAQVVVDHVKNHAESAFVGRIHQALQSVRATVDLVDRVPEHTVVAPVVSSVEAVDRHDFHEADAEVYQVIETFDRGVECSFGGERSDVQFVDR